MDAENAGSAGKRAGESVGGGARVVEGMVVEVVVLVDVVGAVEVVDDEVEGVVVVEGRAVVVVPYPVVVGDGEKSSSVAVTDVAVGGTDDATSSRAPPHDDAAVRATIPTRAARIGAARSVTVASRSPSKWYWPRGTRSGQTDRVLTTTIECSDLDAELAFFRTLAGFRVHLVSPADDPRRAVVHVDGGGALELVRAASDRPVAITLDAAPGDSSIGRAVSPGGSVVEIRSADRRRDEPLGADMAVPDCVSTLTVVDTSHGAFGVGRAGMEYRDLLPDRWGGRFIASNIRIADGGPVDDWVHFHRIRFQMIYVAAGWVEVVYEGQGAPFRMEAGDCVLQPPEIRHRVLRSSPGLDVIEIGCPAEHDTVADHDLDLPTATVDPERTFSGQRFVRHVAADAAVTPWVVPGLTARDTGIGAATDGLAGAVVLAATNGVAPRPDVVTHHGEFALLVGLDGRATVGVGDREVDLAARASVALPAGTQWSWSACTDDHQALLVTLPADSVQPA